MRLFTLPADSAERKEYPLARGCLYYFPAALAGVARHSKIGNDKHNPGEEMHHARGKSGDHEDCIIRHLIDLGDIRAELERLPEIDQPSIEVLLAEVNALSWRALALSQELHERYAGAPLAPRARAAPVEEAHLICRPGGIYVGPWISTHEPLHRTVR